jgi:hypothetical protein
MIAPDKRVSRNLKVGRRHSAEGTRFSHCKSRSNLSTRDSI